MLGRWLNDARSWGTTLEEKNLYEKNARNLITLWGDKNSTLREYSCRQWSGLLNGFYKKRWEQFFVYAIRQMKIHQPVDEKVFDDKIKDWEWNWVNSHETYKDEPNGNAILVAKKIYKKYRQVIESAYQQ